MPTNNLEFLEAGFDPRTLKVPQLRRILTENNVQIPSKAKKNTLLRLYNKDIVPQLDDLRDKYKNAKASSKGIKKIKKHEKNEKSKEVKEIDNEKKKRTRETVQKEEEEEEEKKDVKKESAKPEKANTSEEHKNKKKKKAKKTKKEHTSKSEPAPKVEEVPTSPVKCDSEVDTTNKVNKTVKREVLKPDLSKLKVSPEFATLLKNTSAQDKDEEPKNVDTPEQKTQKVKEEKITIKESVDVVSDSEEEHVKTSNNIEKEAKDKSSKLKAHSRFQWPKLRFRKPATKTTKQEEVDKTQIEKSRFKCCLPKCSLKCISFKKPNCQTMKHCFFNVFIFSLIAIPILYCIWYRQQRIAVGYCGKELPLKSVVPSCLQSFCQDKFNIDLSVVNNWLYYFKPNCLFCPDGAICFPNMELTCHTEHRRILPLFSLNKLIPLSEYCIPDVRKQKYVDGMVSRFANLLQKQNAKVNCGNAKTQVSNSIPRSVFHNIFDRRVDPSWTSHEVADLWELTLKKLNKLPEVETFNVESHEGDVMTVFIRSTSIQRTGIICKYGDAAKAQLHRHKFLLLGTILFFICALLLNSYMLKHAQYNDTVEEYVTVTIEKLRSQTQDAKDGTFLHTLQLRDVILSDVVDLNERKKIWKSMTTVMKKNKNVTCALTEINGEILECWSWKKTEDTEQ